MTAGGIHPIFAIDVKTLGPFGEPYAAGWVGWDETTEKVKGLAFCSERFCVGDGRIRNEAVSTLEHFNWEQKNNVGTPADVVEAVRKAWLKFKSEHPGAQCWGLETYPRVTYIFHRGVYQGSGRLNKVEPEVIHDLATLLLAKKKTVSELPRLQAHGTGANPMKQACFIGDCVRSLLEG